MRSGHVLGWADVEITGITTVADPGGHRAACVAHLLHLAGRDDIPLAAGSDVSSTTLGRLDPVVDERQWPSSITPRPSPPGAALDLLEHSLDAGATLVARNDDVLSFRPNPEGRSIKVVLDVDGAAFSEMWLAAVEAAAG
jgi:hypothetical protein